MSQPKGSAQAVSEPVRPADVPLQETLRYLERVLPPPPLRILEVGAGDGAVAIALAARGYDVAALDESSGRSDAPGADAVRWIEADFLYHEGDETYAALLFTRSLHHMTPVTSAIGRAHALLEPGGLLVGEEFAYDRVTLPTARWYYDLESVLLETGLLAPAHGEAAEGNPLGRWRKDHAHDPPLQSGHAMLAAARERFDVAVAEEAPYLYRYFCERLEESDRGTRVARKILEVESRLLRERDITAAGLRIVGKKTG